MKRYHVYKMDFQGRAAWLSGIFMGIAVFALALEYLFLRELVETGILEQIFCLWLPMAACLGYITLIRVVKWNSPGAMGIAGAVLCLLLIIGTFFDGGVLRILLGVLGYTLCGGLLILAAGGLLPGRFPAVIVLAFVMVFRVLFFSGGSMMPQIADFSILVGLITLPLSFEKIKKRA